MSQVAGLQDLRQQGPPADTGTFQLPAEALVFKHTFGGADYVCAVRAGDRGWVPILILPDTATNATAVIQAAIDGLTAGRTWKETVVIRADLTVQKITVPSYTILEIQGSLTLDDGVNDNMIENADMTNGNTQIEIVEGILYGNKGNQTAGHGIYLWYCTRSKVRHVTVIDAYEDGINLACDSDHKLDTRNAVEHCIVTGAGSRGIRVHHYHRETLVTGNLCFENEGEGIVIYVGIFRGHTIGNICRGNGSDGIYYASSQGGDIVGNMCWFNDERGIYLSAGCAATAISGNAVQENGYEGIFLNSADNCTVTGNMVSINSQAANNAYDNIHLNLASHSTVIGNTCYYATMPNVARHGIYIENTNFASIIGNTLQDHATDGIQIDTDSDDNVLLGNNCEGNGGYGIRIANANCARNRVKDNQLMGNTLGCISDGGTDTRLATKEWLVTYGDGGISLTGDVPLAPLTNGQSAAVGFECPPDFQELVRAKLKVLPTATQAAADWDLDSDYGGVGEAPNTHSEADAATTYNVTNNQWYDIELVALGFFASLAVGDRGGIKLTVSTAGHTVSVFSLVFEYV